MFLPSLLFSYEINKNANADLGFPISKISYSNNARNQFAIENNFNGYFYNTDQKIQFPGESEKISFSQMSTTFQFERKFDENFTLSLKGGYDFNKKFSLNNADDSIKNDYKISDGPTFRFGIKYQL